MTHPLSALAELGQSVWYDNLSREFLRTGELLRTIQEDGVSGVTSNPTIFEKAISNDRVYDHVVHELVDTGRDVSDIYEELVATDVRAVADLLDPVYEGTKGLDGYVCLEVSPHLAYDTEATVRRALHLHGLVDRRNLMVKVPGTFEGLKAMSDLLAQGVNVNATLIFSQEQYRETISAYLDGVERWIDSGGDPGHIASVASFFVSRVDRAIDEILKEIVDPKAKPAARSLLGKAGIANAKIAYATYQEAFHGPRFALFREKGVRPQRIIWASMGTKNPEYADTYYVEALIGPETVTTLPKITLDAYRRHGRPAARLKEGVEAAHDLFGRLEQLGVDLVEVMDCLVEDGVNAFAESYDQLMCDITKKRTRLLRGWGHRSASLGDLQKKVDETLEQFDTQKVAESLWAGDVTLWSADPEQSTALARRLGWLTVVENMVPETYRLKQFAQEVRDAGFTNAVLLGMGGSCLAPEMFCECFGTAEGFLDLKVLDTTVPETILALERELDLERTLFIVSSKSGQTVEALCLYAYFWAKMEGLVGNKAGSHFVAVTDPGTSLGRLARDKGFRKTFLNPPTVGGRFSALSYVGLVPAALIGMDLDRLLMRAMQSVESAGPEVPALENQGMWLGTCLAEASLKGKDKLSLVVSPRIVHFGFWLEQLLAESTGKAGKGIIPIVDELPGSPEVYGDDRLFVYLRIDDQGVFDEQISALERYGHPVITLRLHTPFDLGREIFRWQLATAIAGIILGISPFDEPEVAESKKATLEILERYNREKQLPEVEGMKAGDPGLSDSLRAFLGEAGSGDYVAFQAFMHPTDETMSTLQAMRAAVRDKLGIATTVGWGPGCLHCTGQMHKGGANKGLFIQITSHDAEDVPIPGKAYTFGVLKAAQALGEYEALKNKGRRIMRVHLAGASDLNILADALSAALM
jgi:transaldolase / glucose-6-phosphate isomerase